MFPVEPISGKMLDYYVGRKDSFLIDLRNPKEYHTGHIKGAVNVPYEEFEEMQTYDFPKGKILVLYCDRGGASLQAARILARNGYKTKTVMQIHGILCAEQVMCGNGIRNLTVGLDGFFQQCTSGGLYKQRD